MTTGDKKKPQPRDWVGYSVGYRPNEDTAHALGIKQDYLSRTAVCGLRCMPDYSYDDGFWTIDERVRCHDCEEGIREQENTMRDVAASDRTMYQDFTVTPVDYLDEEVSECPELFGDVDVTFGEFAAHDQSDVIERSLQILRQLPGVDQVEREDRELIRIWGKKADYELIRSSLERFWSENQP